MFFHDIELQIETAHDPDFSGDGLDQRDGRFAVLSQMETVVCGNPDQDPPLSEQPCLIGGDG